MTAIIDYIIRTLRGVAGAASTAAAAWCVYQLANWGFDVDAKALEAVLFAIAGGLVLWVERLLNHYVPRLRWLLTLVRFGSSLPLYAHQSDELADYVAKHAKAA